MQERDVRITTELWRRLNKLKFDGGYTSIDEALRPLVGLDPGPRPYLKGMDPNAPPEDPAPARDLRKKFRCDWSEEEMHRYIMTGEAPARAMTADESPSPKSADIPPRSLGLPQKKAFPVRAR